MGKNFPGRKGFDGLTHSLSHAKTIDKLIKVGKKEKGYDKQYLNV